ncbi:hypothetical protein MM817_02752 [Acidibacillus sp. S0AB]|uniref:Uncharacterized protein n=2 Tax=Sulfoacidibacillus ferrooxidans TaxID=2005001 RepID=A0A9X1VB31_9BACL|nr:hypothetical protein [Sulfoacidibacillus ferrooxidans]
MTLGFIPGNHSKGVIAELSGYIPDFVKEEYNIKLNYDQMDQVLPYEWGRANEEFFRGLSANVTFRTYPEPHTIMWNICMIFNLG